jgi:hypothetical protein
MWHAAVLGALLLQAPSPSPPAASQGEVVLELIVEDQRGRPL